jgi:TRAP-type C4-dicarboxylate transport system substrate-binding protein
MGAILGSFGLAWRQTSSVPLRVLGQPSTAGQLQRGKEQPFFQQLASSARLPLEVRYYTADSYGLVDSHQLDAIRDGRLDIISLRFMQNTQKEPGLGGLDLPAMNPDFETARRVADAYTPVLDRYLQKTYGARLLGVWSFGPQVLFCKDPIARLSDIRGRKVRVASPSLAQTIDVIGGTAVTLPFGDTKEALRLGLVNCAVTSTASADFADWGAHTNYYVPLVLQFGFNGYVISNRKWNSLTDDQQQRLSQAFSRYVDNIWNYSKQRQKEAEACLTEGPCLSRPPRGLQRVPVSSQDMGRLQQISRQVALPSWLELCEREHPGCGQDWNQSVGPLTALGSAKSRP